MISHPQNGMTLTELLSTRHGTGITYDDINVIPPFIDQVPKPEDVDLKVELAHSLETLPIISSPMDTVTEWRMAVQMALNGCLGVLHINLSIDEMVAQIEKVKRFQMGFIKNPVCLPRHAKVRDAIVVREKHGFSTIPITEGEDGSGKFLGLITRSCVDLETDQERPLVELMLPPKNLLTPHTREVPTLDEAKRIFRCKPGVAKLPIIDDLGQLVALVSRKNVAESTKYPATLVDANKQLRVAAAVSTHSEDDTRVEAILAAGVDAIVIDSSQGGTSYAVARIRQIRRHRNDIPIIAGNVVAPSQAKHLQEAGANIMRVGMGSGSICITQGQYGLGRAQGSAVAYNPGCIADGGIRNSGDMLKALALGAKAVMVGSFIAGCDETPSELVELNGGRYRMYRGMGSAAAMRARGATRYGGESGNNETRRVIAQGVEGLVPAIGPLDDRLSEALAGLRGALSQLGCRSVADLHEHVSNGSVRFEIRSPAAKSEGDVHDVQPIRS